MRTIYLVGLLLFAACDRSEPGENPDAGGLTGFALVTTASFTSSPPSGALGTVRLEDRQVTQAIDTTLDADNDVRCAGGRCYVLDRTHGTVRIYDPGAAFRNAVEIRTGDANVPAPQANPHDALPIPGTTKLYVALYNNPAAQALGVIDTAAPSSGITRFITLPQAAADADGRPEPNNLYFCQGRVYVTLEDLDTSSPNYAPTGPGRIVAVDPGRDEVVGEIQLAGENPVALAALTTEGSDCSRVLVADGSLQFGAATGQGGIEEVDLGQGRSLRMVALDTALGGHPGSLTLISSTLGYAVLNLADFTSKVVAFHPSTGALLGDVAGPAGYIPFVQHTPSGREIYVGVNSGDPGSGQLAPGLYVGPADGSRLVAAPLNLGQSPSAISFY
ncbi:MAG TPA: hypothetical protein VH877_06595 [Polyangia bacterium]|jgi:hypothetical protein|nr:hypothetical protein [Polyangia bacterium]